VSGAARTSEPAPLREPPQASAPLELVREVVQQPGAPLDARTRARLEGRFGHDFGRVRVHTDARAGVSADELGAEAWTLGTRIVFAPGRYAAGSAADERLLAHELAHVVRQEPSDTGGTIRIGGADEPAEQEARTLAGRALAPGRVADGGGRLRPSGSRARVVRRQQVAVQRPPVRQATVTDAAEFLEEMARFIEGARDYALTVIRSALGAPSATVRQRAHAALNQRKLRDLLANARRTFEVQAPTLEGGSADGTRLRRAMLAVIAKVREVAPQALAISDAMTAPTPATERGENAELVLELIEADPFTSAGLLGTPAFGPAETAAGATHEAFIEAYLDDLIRTLPGQALRPADRDRILERISAGLRRAFLTVAAGPGGTVDVRGITNPGTVAKYHRVNELLSAAMSARPPQLSIITTPLPAYVLPPDPVPDVTAQFGATNVDLTRVPASEITYVRHGVLAALNTIFPATSTIQRRDASWPVALQVRRAGAIVRVRYDLIFDAAANLRVERLGEAAPREVAPAFAQLSVPDKKRQLIADFGLAAVDDRPAAPARPAARGRRAVPARPAAAWTGPELDQVKAAYDVIPAADRAALRGVTLVRDHQGPSHGAGQTLQGFAHTSRDTGHDEPVPPPHGPPHIHYYDDAFDQNAITAVGGPGSTGPGADWTLTHEVGHMRIFLATRQANAALDAAARLVVPADLRAAGAGLPRALHQIRLAWSQARTAANTAIQDLNRAVVATPPAGPAQRAPLLQAAQAAVRARDQARANLAAAGVPAAMVQAATNLDAAADATLAAVQSLGVAADQIPTFVSLAGTFAFTPFTDYARSGGPDEFFAETYALYLTDPSRLSAMNRSIFLWFEAGMPMDPTWRPPP
jgi:Domain of unknown function (DUF4157)